MVVRSCLVVQVERVEQMPGKDNVRVSVLNLCDLAGSEDRSKTLAVGKAAEEGTPAPRAHSDGTPLWC
jgi:uncharacterized caspase-like protein